MTSLKEIDNLINKLAVDHEDWYLEQVVRFLYENLDLYKVNRDVFEKNYNY